MRAQATLEPPGDDDQRDWAILEDRFASEDDSWSVGVDEWAPEEEHPFQYPAGLP